MADTTLAEDLAEAKRIEDTLQSNKVANFAYTDEAYSKDLASGVTNYDYSRGNNIPKANAEVLNVNDTVLNKGWRTEASSITRMLMNHFLGRLSYNLNKANDILNLLIKSLTEKLGAPNGYASLDYVGKLKRVQIPETLYSATYVVNSDEALTYWLSNKISGTSSGGDDFSYVLIKKGTWTYQGSTANVSSEMIKGETGSIIILTDYNAVIRNNLELSPNASIENVIIKHNGSVALKNFNQVTNCQVYSNSDFFITYIPTKGVCWSEDGMVWNESNIISDDTSNALATFYNGIWVLTTANRGIKWSENGKSWTDSNVTLGSFNSKAIHANTKSGLSVWVVAGYQGIYTSTTGKQWTKITATSPASSFIKVLFANEVFVALNENGGIYTSIDASNWQLVNVTQDKYIYDVDYADGTWLAVGQGDSSNSFGGKWRSIDGLSWKNDYDTITKYETLNEVRYVDGTWTVYSSSKAYVSKDTYTWVVLSSSTKRFWTQAHGIMLAFDYGYSQNSYIKWGKPTFSNPVSVNSQFLNCDITADKFCFIHFIKGLWLAIAINGMYWSNNGKLWHKNENISYTVPHSSGYAISSKTATIESCKNVRGCTFALKSEDNSSTDFFGCGQLSTGYTAEGGYNKTTVCSAGYYFK